MNLEEFAKLHPELQEETPEQAQMLEQALTLKERREAAERAQELTATILTQLQQGSAPQFVLYTAIRALECYTLDQEWAEQCRAELDKVYKDTAQLSLFNDQQATERARLEQKQLDYCRKVRQQLQRDLCEYKRIEQGLLDTLKAINQIDPIDAIIE